MLVRKKLWPKVFYFTPDSVIKKTIHNNNSPKPVACVSDEHKRYSVTHHVVTKPPDSKPG